MLLLAFDTSGAAVSVAVHDGERVLAEVGVAGSQRHAEQLTPAIVAALAQAGRDRRELTGVVVGVGPGPFTGLRVGLVTASVLGLTLEVAVHGLCSLDALAETAVAAGQIEPFVVATDARRREVYWAGYQVAVGRWRRVEGPFVMLPAQVPVGGRRVFGRGGLLYPEGLSVTDLVAPQEVSPDVSAGALAAIAARALAAKAAGDLAAKATGELVEPRPWYLRRPDAVAPGERKRVRR